jgi:hypothetical protein
MSEKINTMPTSNDDVDLIVVLERIERFISGNLKILIATTIAGLICGLLIYYNQPKTYSSTLILRTQVLSNNEEIQILTNWDNLLSNGEYDVLSRMTACPPNVLSKLKSIRAESISTPQSILSAFSVLVLVSDTSILADLQKAIINGLENTEFVQAKVNFKKENTTQMIADINQEINKLDSMKKKIESSNMGKSASPPSFIVDISNLNVQMITLREKLNLNQENLKFADAIQIMQPFEKYEKPTGPRLSILAISGLLGGLFIGLLISIMKNIRMKITLMRKNRQHPYTNGDLA